MQSAPIFLTTRGVSHGFIKALQSCEAISQIPPHSVERDNIQYLPFEINIENGLDPREISLAAQNITRLLKGSNRDVYVDTVALTPALALLNRYGKYWGVDELMLSRLYQVVYDPLFPERAEVIDTIQQALYLLQEYSSSIETQEMPSTARND